MKTKCLAYVFCSLIFLPSTAFPKAIRLTTGEVLIGEVRGADFEEIELAVSFPYEQQLRLGVSQVDPLTYYEILANRLDLNDPQSRVKIVQFCLDHGLFAHAVMEARSAVKLDPTLGGRFADLHDKAAESIAERLLEDAKTYLAVDRPDEARVYLQSIVDRYSDTRSARTAKRLLRSVETRKRSKDRKPSRDPRKKDAIRKELKKAKNLMTTADRRIGDLDQPYKPGRGAERLLRSAEPYYRKSFLLLRKAGSRPTDNETLNRELRTLTAESRSKLAKLYVALGRIYLLRGAVELAESFSSKAYAVDPENKARQELQEKILDSRILFQ